MVHLEIESQSFHLFLVLSVAGERELWNSVCRLTLSTMHNSIIQCEYMDLVCECACVVCMPNI